MVDVTVTQLAQVVGIPIERLLNQLQEAGLTFTDATQIVNEDQKRVLLDYLKRGASTQDMHLAPNRITLKRKSITRVTLGNDQHSAKTINVEVRKKKVYVKRSVVQEAAEVVNEVISTEPDVDVPDDTLDNIVTESSVVDLETSAVETIENLNPENLNPVLPEPVIDKPKKTTLVKASKHVDEPEEKSDKNIKRRHGKDDGEAKAIENRKHKQNPQYLLMTLDEDDGSARHKRFKSKKRKSDEKSDRYREAEETLTHAFAMPTMPAVHEVLIPETITVSALAKNMSVKVAEVIKTLMGLGAAVTINQVIDQETAAIVVEEMGHTVKMIHENAIENTLGDYINRGLKSESRAPVVTIMGHVDHGKTSLLDYIRRTKVATGEAGGITQHIGAYHVTTPKGQITFLDTPGHAAFTAMRARGAKVTDIVVLIVAADDGVKPQTIEAIQHAKAAKVPLIVAVNKMDKHDADIDRIMNDLSQYEVIAETWGGTTQFVKISAKTGLGIDELLDAILLQAEMLDLKAIVDGAASGVVIESRLDKGRGPVATILVQSGTLRKGDILLAGLQYGRVRALVDDAGHLVSSAGPSMPVEVIGLSAVPHAGDDSVVVPDEKKAREVALFRQGKFRDVKLARKQKTSLEGLFEHMTQGEVKTLNIVLKADVQGSIEAINDALTKLSNDEVKVFIISSGVGGITESDVHLTMASNAILVGFNVRADSGAKRLAEQESVILNYYSVIYDIVDQVRAALSGMLASQFKEQILGIAEVRDVFRSPKLGAIAGCMVQEGVVKRNGHIRVLRNHVVIYEGTLESLRRFKEDQSEVRQGFECGIGVKNYNDVRAGDMIEVFEMIEVKREI